MFNIQEYLIPKKSLYTKLKKAGYRVDLTIGLEYAFKDNNSNVLLVAHCDTVQPVRLDDETKHRVTGAGFDDRLGIAMCDRLASELSCDVLITDHEEIGRSTASNADIPLERYNLIIGLDREGTDVVTYDIDSPEWLEALEDYWHIGHGSFSDIVALSDRIDTCMVNVGTGHYGAHDIDSYYIKTEAEMQYNKAAEFIKQYRGERFVVTDNGWNLHGDIYGDMCDFCFSEVFENGKCVDCGERL